MLKKRIERAVGDLRHLLDQGYPRDSAVNFVSNHHCLLLDQRHLLARCVFSKAEVAYHRAKAVGEAEVRGKRLGVDGYNVLITLESILMKKQVVRCDDGFVRDLRALFGKYKVSTATSRALNALVRTIARAGPSHVLIFFDRQMSKSGELAAEVRRRLQRAKLRGDAKTAAEVDLKLRSLDVVASSDRAVIERAKAVWDIPAEILKRKKAANVISVSRMGRSDKKLLKILERPRKSA